MTQLTLDHVAAHVNWTAKPQMRALLAQKVAAMERRLDAMEAGAEAEQHGAITIERRGRFYYVHQHGEPVNETGVSKEEAEALKANLEG